jgi:hypothetical protein
VSKLNKRVLPTCASGSMTETRPRSMTREEIEQKMVELARKYAMTHDPGIIKELYELARELEKVEKVEKK